MINLRAENLLKVLSAIDLYFLHLFISHIKDFAEDIQNDKIDTPSNGDFYGLMNFHSRNFSLWKIENFVHHLQWWNEKKIGIEFNLHFCSAAAELIWQSTRNEMRCVEMRLTLLWKNLVAWNWFNSCITRISRFLLHSVWKPFRQRKG